MTSLLNIDNDKTRTAIAVGATVGTAYILYHALTGTSQQSACSTLRGPKSPSFLQGHLRKLVDFDIKELEEWLKEYGDVFAAKGFVGLDHLVVADPKAAAYIFGHSMEFTKPGHLTRAILAWTGPGLFAAELDAHKKQVSVVGRGVCAMLTVRCV